MRPCLAGLLAVMLTGCAGLRPVRPDPIADGLNLACASLPLTDPTGVAALSVCSASILYAVGGMVYAACK